MIRTLFVTASVAALALPTTAHAETRWSAAQQEIVDLLGDGPMGIETDFDSWAREFHDDWTVWFPGQGAARGKADHMASVRAYIDGGAQVVSYQADFADIAILGDTALARFNAVETLQEADGSERIVHYGSTDYLIRVDDAWKVRATTVAIQPAPQED